MTIRLFLAAALFSTPALAQSPVRPGLYEITYRLEMPHLERYAMPGRARVCIEDAPPPVMSGKGAFDQCAIADWRAGENELSYSRVCRGASGARAFARYTARDDGFTGRIFVKLGAKNMTLTELQTGRRLGDCGG